MLEKIVIAGAFGYHLKTESLRRTGIIPAAFAGEVEFLGNTCRSGCAIMLADASSRSCIKKKMNQDRYLAIAEKPDFQMRFVENISFTS